MDDSASEANTGSARNFGRRSCFCRAVSSGWPNSKRLTSGNIADTSHIHNRWHKKKH